MVETDDPALVEKDRDGERAEKRKGKKTTRLPHGVDETSSPPPSPLLFFFFLKLPPIIRC